MNIIIIPSSGIQPAIRHATASYDNAIVSSRNVFAGHNAAIQLEHRPLYRGSLNYRHWLVFRPPPTAL